jgi:hypothetical protein
MATEVDLVLRQIKILQLIQDDLGRGNKARLLLVDVAAMRALQREYFKSRNRDVLIQSKSAEKKVDEGLEELRRKATP